MVDGVPQESSAYTIHSAANLFVDDEAVDGENPAETWPSGATDAAGPGVSAEGHSSIAILPTGGVAVYIRPVDMALGMSGSMDLTAVGAVKVTHAADKDYRLVASWYDVSTGFLGSASSSTVAIDSADDWVVLSGLFTTPANTVKAFLNIQRITTSGTDTFFADCWGFAPGTYDTWHLPSQAPGLVEFASPPSNGAVVTCSGTGTRITRCVIDPSSRRTIAAGQYSSIGSITAIESPEV
jgi:hypothetical protein